MGKPVVDTVRPSVAADTEVLARLWWSAWHDAHAKVLPIGLVASRTPGLFHDRVTKQVSQLHVLGEHGNPIGLTGVSEDELKLLFVARHARGTAAAATLMRYSEQQLEQSGHKRIWLGCAVGNNRAARFYEKHGWSRVAELTEDYETNDGVFEVSYWRYEKSL